MDTRKAIANRLLELCEQKRLSVNALARISAVPPSTLKNIINGGSKNAGVVTLKKLCDGLEISLYEFFNTENEVAFIIRGRKLHYSIRPTI